MGIDTKSMLVYFKQQWTPGTDNTHKGNNNDRMGTLLPHFKDMVLIAPKDLNHFPVTSQYNEITVKQVKKKYFEVECPRTKPAVRKSKRH